MPESRKSAAATLAQELLRDELPDRFAHVAGVAARAEEVCRALRVPDEVVVTAAWLHDIGYSSAVVATGFHPLDGARYAARAGYPAEVGSLVAFHTSADVEAEERGCLQALVTEFGRPDVEALDVLTYCDMNVGPRGQNVSVDDRISEIFERYGPDDVVHRSTCLAEPELRAVVDRVDRRVAGQSQ